MYKKTFILIFIFLFILILSSFSCAFEDINGHWCEEDIKQLYTEENIEVYDNNFEPDRPITKAEFCMMINSVLNYSKSIENDNWQEEQFNIGIEKGYMPIGSVDDTLTREETCVIFERISDLVIEDALNGRVFEEYDDYENVSLWAQKAVKRMVINGKIIGYTDNTLRMKQKLTKAEFVKIMTRFRKDKYEIANNIDFIKEKKLALATKNEMYNFRNEEMLTRLNSITSIFDISRKQNTIPELQIAMMNNDAIQTKIVRNDDLSLTIDTEEKEFRNHIM